LSCTTTNSSSSSNGLVRFTTSSTSIEGRGAHRWASNSISSSIGLACPNLLLVVLESLVLLQHLMIVFDIGPPRTPASVSTAFQNKLVHFSSVNNSLASASRAAHS
jgi:hypothetical protein